MVRGDSLNYAHAAFELSQGRLHFGSWAGTSRFGMYVPVALLYYILGPSDFSTLLFPLLSSLATVVFIFLIARLFSNNSAGLIAAFLWAFLPLDIFLSTSLLPDAPVAALSTAAIYFLLSAIKSNEAHGTRLLLPLFLILAAILVKPIALMTLFAALALYVSANTKLIQRLQAIWEERILPRNTKALKWAALFMLVLAFYVYASIQPHSLLVTLARTSADLGNVFLSGLSELDVSGVRLATSDLLIFLTPLLIISLIWALSKKYDEIKPLIIWLAVVFLYYEWGTINLKVLFYVPLQSFNEARNFLFVLAPLIIICALYLSQFIAKNKLILAIPVIALITMLLAWISRDQILAVHTPLFITAAALLVPIFALFSINRLQSANSRWNPLFMGFFLLFLALASLRPAIPYHAAWYAERSEKLTMLKSTLSRLKQFPQRPILINGTGNAMSLNYVSDFELGFDWANNQDPDIQNRIIVGSPPTNGPLYSIEFGERSEPQRNWKLEATYEGFLGNQLQLMVRE